MYIYRGAIGLSDTIAKVLVALTSPAPESGSVGMSAVYASDDENTKTRAETVAPIACSCVTSGRAEDAVTLTAQNGSRSDGRSACKTGSVTCAPTTWIDAISTTAIAGKARTKRGVMSAKDSAAWNALRERQLPPLLRFKAVPL